MKELKLFRIYKSDGCSSRTPTEICFKDEKSAKLYIEPHKGYCYATDLTLKIYDDYSDYVNNNTEQLRKNALKKLTKEEKIALGLLGD